MLVWDESFTAALQAGEAEARRLGARAYGSEHALLGLLAAGDDATRAVQQVAPDLDLVAVRRAVTDAVDDRPYLESLGIDLDAVPAARPEEALPSSAAVRKHTAEFQVALNDSSAKWGRLTRQRKLPFRAKVTAPVLWLAVLEPAARASRLLEAMGHDPDRLRPAVLAAMAGPGRAAPEWPAEVRRGLLDRLTDRFFERVNVAS